MAVALVAAALSVSGAPPAAADHGRTNDVWSATLTAAEAQPDVGYDDFLSLGALSNRNFTYQGVDYVIEGVIQKSGSLSFRFSTIPTSLRSSALTLHVGNSQFALSGSTLDSKALVWNNSGLSWSAGDTVELKLSGPYWTGVDLYGGDMVHQADGYQYMDLNEGNNGTFRVRLDQAPTAEVTITIGKLSTFEIDDFDAATVSPQTLTFTTSNWQTGQSVTVTAATDGDGDDDRIIISARVSIASGAGADDPYRNPERVNGFVLTVTDTTVGGG